MKMWVIEGNEFLTNISNWRSFGW